MSSILVSISPSSYRANQRMDIGPSLLASFPLFGARGVCAPLLRHSVSQTFIGDGRTDGQSRFRREARSGKQARDDAHDERSVRGDSWPGTAGRPTSGEGRKGSVRRSIARSVSQSSIISAIRSVPLVPFRRQIVSLPQFVFLSFSNLKGYE